MNHPTRAVRHTHSVWLQLQRKKPGVPMSHPLARPSQSRRLGYFPPPKSSIASHVLGYRAQRSGDFVLVRRMPLDPGLVTVRATFDGVREMGSI